jgi:hypothetical protein
MSQHANGVKRRVLVVANETIGGAELMEAIRARAAGEATEVLVVAPALNSRLRHWISDEDRARREAGLRLGACLQELGHQGIEANGWVGDADPLLSITDTLHLFSVDEIVIATHPERARTGWRGESSTRRVASFPSRSTTSSSMEPPPGTWPRPNFKTGVRHLVLSSPQRAEC